MTRDSRDPGSVSSSPGGAIPHVPVLDGLRGVAISMVLMLHFVSNARFPDTEYPFVGRCIERLAYVGWAGVDLFFVISGFLISSILLASREEHSYYKLFYSRRVLRIFPLYLGTLVAGLVLLSHAPAGLEALAGEAPQHAWWLFLYLANVAMALGVVKSFGIFDVYWTLAIEEQFYVAWPWLVRRLGPRRLAWLCATLVIMGPVTRAGWIGAGLEWTGAYRFTLTRLDGLAMGSLLAVTRYLGGAPWARTVRVARKGVMPLMVALAVTFARIDPFYPQSPFVLVAGHSLLALFFGSILTLVVDGRGQWAERFLTLPWLSRIGLYSYGAYVLHWPLLQVMLACHLIERVGITSRFGAAVLFLFVGVSGAIALGAASYHFYEQHFLKLRRLFSYAKSPQPT